MSRSTNTEGSWVYLVGVAAILFVAFVWNAPLDWFSDLITNTVQDSVKDLTPTTTTTIP